jgi:solute carrier family 25 S-adenosylmethionine transporter 26
MLSLLRNLLSLCLLLSLSDAFLTGANINVRVSERTFLYSSKSNGDTDDGPIRGKDVSIPLLQFRDPQMTRSSFFASAAAALMALPAVAEASSTPMPSMLKSQTLPRVATFIPETSTSLLTAAAQGSALQESLSGFVAGGALVLTKTLVKYPLDTATVRLQMPNSKYSLLDLVSLFRGSYNGMSLTLLSNIPGGAVFFAVKDATKASLKQSVMAPNWVITCIAVAAAQIPYWIIRNPSEVIKVRQQANIEGYGEGVTAFSAIQKTLETSAAAKQQQQQVSSDNSTAAAAWGSSSAGLQEFYTGYWENIIYAYPADVIKFVTYESITQGRKDLSPIQGAQAGALATAVAQLVTTPLDVVRNRLMTGRNSNGVLLTEKEKDVGYLESLTTLAREEGLAGLFAGASPRVGKAILSGAIQFATYEETKRKIASWIQR